MARKSNPMVWIVAVGAIVFLVVMIRLSLQQTRQEYEVCVTFKGNTHCSTAAGSTQGEAVQSAQGIDCQMLAQGRDETMVCMGNPPSSVRRIQK